MKKLLSEWKLGFDMINMIDLIDKGVNDLCSSTLIKLNPKSMHMKM